MERISLKDKERARNKVQTLSIIFCESVLLPQRFVGNAIRSLPSVQAGSGYFEYGRSLQRWEAGCSDCGTGRVRQTEWKLSGKWRTFVPREQVGTETDIKVKGTRQQCRTPYWNAALPFVIKQPIISALFYKCYRFHSLCQKHCLHQHERHVHFLFSM